MKNGRFEEKDYKRLFNDFIDCFSKYMSKEDIKIMFYSKVFLIYLAKKNNIDLKKYLYEDFFCGYELILKDLIDMYADMPGFHKEAVILYDIRKLLNQSTMNERPDSKIFVEMSNLSKTELKEIFKMNSLELKNYSDKENDATEESIVELVSSILNVKKQEDVLDLCSGNGDFLVHLTQVKGVNLSAIEINEKRALISKIRLSVLGDTDEKIIINDVLTHEFDVKFNKIFCEYPLDFRIDKYKLNQLADDLIYTWCKAGLTSDWIFINKALTLLEVNGMAALIITEGALFKTMDTTCRRNLLEKGFVKSIIKLPSGILPYKNISANLIILSKDNKNEEVKFIDATNEYIVNNKKKRELNVKSIMDLLNGVSNDVDKVKTEKKADLIKTDDVLLTVNSYVKKNEPNYINPQVLKDYLIDDYRGYQFLAKELAEIEDINGDYNLLNISDINDGMISDNLIKIDGNNNKYDRYLLQDGDIVITSKGTKIKVAVVNIKNRKIIPNGNLLVLRLNMNKMLPHYLAAFLNSENGRLALEKIQTGAKIISINPSRIEQMKISMKDIDEQKKFSEKYQRKMREYTLALEHLKELKDEIDNLYKNEIEKNNEGE